MTEEIEYPTAICSITEPHAKHIISGTWRQQCPGIETPANATIDQLIAESAELRQQLALAKQDADTFRAERDALKAMYRALAADAKLAHSELTAERLARAEHESQIASMTREYDEYSANARKTITELVDSRDANNDALRVQRIGAQVGDGTGSVLARTIRNILDDLDQELSAS